MHRIRYWLNNEVADEVQFREDVRTVCKLYHQAAELHEQGVHVISTDEKTGIQALERLHPTRPMALGKPEAQEFEYVRHGTQVLIANFEVARGCKPEPPKIPVSRESMAIPAEIDGFLWVQAWVLRLNRIFA